MSEEINKAIDALAGGTKVGGTPPADTTDWKAKYEEAQRELNSARVEQGRVKKLNEEKSELERKLAEAQSARGVQSAIEALPDNLRTDTPEDYQKVAAIMAQQAVSKAVQEAEARRKAELDTVMAQMAEREKREADAKRADFGARVEREFPGFLKSAVLEGGDKYEAWVAYQRFNAASINVAVQKCDFDTLAYHIRAFYRNELGVEPPSGGTGAAAPDPSATGGGNPVTPKSGKTYTDQELSELFDKKEAARDRGDWAEVKRLTDEINRAQAAAGQQ